MRYIIAIIQPDRLDDVLQILEEKEIHLVTVTNVLTQLVFAPKHR